MNLQVMKFKHVISEFQSKYHKGWNLGMIWILCPDPNIKLCIKVFFLKSKFEGLRWLLQTLCAAENGLIFGNLFFVLSFASLFASNWCLLLLLFTIIVSHHAITTFLHIDVVFLFIIVVLLALLLLFHFALLLQHAFNTCFFIYLSCVLSHYCSYVLPSYYSSLYSPTLPSSPCILQV